MDLETLKTLEEEYYYKVKTSLYFVDKKRDKLFLEFIPQHLTMNL